MDFSDLRTRVHAAAQVDVGPHIEHFRTHSPGASAQACLEYLHRHGVIDARVFHSLSAQEPVDGTTAPVASSITRK